MAAQAEFDVNFCIYCRKKLKISPKFKFCLHCTTRFKLPISECNPAVVNGKYARDMKFCYNCGAEDEVYEDEDEKGIKLCLNCDLRIDFRGKEVEKSDQPVKANQENITSTNAVVTEKSPTIEDNESEQRTEDIGKDSKNTNALATSLSDALETKDENRMSAEGIEKKTVEENKLLETGESAQSIVRKNEIEQETPTKPWLTESGKRDSENVESSSVKVISEERGSKEKVNIPQNEIDSTSETVRKQANAENAFEGEFICYQLCENNQKACI